MINSSLKHPKGKPLLTSTDMVSGTGANLANLGMSFANGGLPSISGAGGITVDTGDGVAAEGSSPMAAAAAGALSNEKTDGEGFERLPSLKR